MNPITGAAIFLIETRIRISSLSAGWIPISVGA
jgi:hypothetical protein